MYKISDPGGGGGLLVVIEEIPGGIRLYYKSSTCGTNSTKKIHILGEKNCGIKHLHSPL